MPVRMAASFAECTPKIELTDADKSAFSFTQLLMNGDAAAAAAGSWQHGIGPEGGATPPVLPSVLPQSDFIVNPLNAAADEYVIRVPPPAPSAKDKKRKGASKDLSCITATQPAKTEEPEEKRNPSSKRSKPAPVKEEGSKAEESENTENKKKQGKENSKPSAADGKQDYIHVRARRGQATDSHSLAERVRREKISERMKMLQDLVPGCSKVTGKAMMLDEIINYVQSLQRQVEFLSMKLASVKPRLELFQDDAYLVNEVRTVANNDEPFSRVSQDANGFSDLHHDTQQHHQQPQPQATPWQTMSSTPMITSVENYS